MGDCNVLTVKEESILVIRDVGIQGAPGALRIDGYFVDPVGKTNKTEWEVNDKFWGWVDNTRYVTGIVVALSFDVDDNTKVKLAIDNLI